MIFQQRTHVHAFPPCGVLHTKGSQELNCKCCQNAKNSSAMAGPWLRCLAAQEQPTSILMATTNLHRTNFHLTYIKLLFFFLMFPKNTKKDTNIPRACPCLKSFHHKMKEFGFWRSSTSVLEYQRVTFNIRIFQQCFQLDTYADNLISSRSISTQRCKIQRQTLAHCGFLLQFCFMWVNLQRAQVSHVPTAPTQTLITL